MARDRATHFENRRHSAAAWKTRKLALGLCATCGREPLASRAFCANCLEKHRLRQRVRRQTAAEKRKRVAREAVRQGLMYGKLTKPTQCPRCGGTGRLEAHHQDYTQKRDVMWLCGPCHGKQHQLG